MFQKNEDKTFTYISPKKGGIWSYIIYVGRKIFLYASLCKIYTKTHVFFISNWVSKDDGMLFRPNALPKWSPSAHVAQVEMSRGTLTSLSQTGECFLLTFDLGRQDVNNKNNHGIGQINHGSTTEWINHGARPQKLQTTSWNVLLRLVAGLRHC